MGAGGVTTITIPMEGASGSLEISATPKDWTDTHVRPPDSPWLSRATHGGTEIGSIDLTRCGRRDRRPWRRSRMAPATVNEGDKHRGEITLTLSVQC